MDTIFINSKNKKASDPYRLLVNLMNLKKSNKHLLLSNLSIYFTWQNIKKTYKNNKH